MVLIYFFIKIESDLGPEFFHVQDFDRIENWKEIMMELQMFIFSKSYIPLFFVIMDFVHIRGCNGFAGWFATFRWGVATS